LEPGLLLPWLEEHPSAVLTADDLSLSPQSGDPAMKKTLFLLCIFSATAAFAQQNAASLNSQVTLPQFISHEAHANYVSMSPERSILASSSYASAQGERPASDFPQAEAVSLGAYAREIRKEHAQLKKSRVVWVNQ
jgi:hypothetical protein